MDKKELGAAVTASAYSTQMATDFLQSYKLPDWVRRQTSGRDVTPADRRQRAEEIATALNQHERWKNHGHAISRHVLWQEIKLLFDHPDPPLERAIIRAWALCHWLLDKSLVVKFFTSANYSLVRSQVVKQTP